MTKHLKKITHLLLQAPMLRYYNANEEVTIQCDASKYGFGCVLMQNRQPVVFASKLWSETEKRYA